VPADSGGPPGETVPKVPTESWPLPATKSVHVLPFAGKIRDSLVRGLTAQRIYQDLVEENGYRYGYDAVKRYARKLRKRLPKLFDHLPVHPGEEAQVDFAKGSLVKYKGKYRRAWLFKMTLSFSGHSYEEMVFSQDVETFLRCHEHAFHYFNGVPERIKLDNLKSGVLRAHLYEPQINPAYMSFAIHYGFTPDPCLPRKPEHKGRVERDIRYTCDNALKGRKFESLEDANLFLKSWNKHWARTRIHGSKKRQVWQMFVEFDQPVLRPLPAKSFAFFRPAERKVDNYGSIEVQGNYYTVPHTLIGQKVAVHYNTEEIKVFESGTLQLIAHHRTASGHGGFYKKAEHRPSWKPQSLEELEGWKCQKAKEVGPHCHALVYKILSGPEHPGNMRRCNGIFSCVQKYGKDIVNQACAEALAQHDYRYAVLQNICEQLSKGKAAATPALTQTHELIRDASEYQAIINERINTYGSPAECP
jgi:transposase